MPIDPSKNTHFNGNKVIKVIIKEENKDEDPVSRITEADLDKLKQKIKISIKIKIQVPTNKVWG